MPEHDEQVLSERCTNCGTRLKRYPVTDTTGTVTGHDVGCPNFYRNDDCPEVIREVRE